MVNTTAALDKYFSFKPALSLAWDSAYTNEQVTALVALEAHLSEQIADAYFEDTKQVNCRANCSLLSLNEFMRQANYERKQ